MEIRRHGLSIGIEKDNNKFFLYLEVIGKLTHEDYGVITPMIESALAGVTEPKMRVFIDGSAMEGWEPRAAWDDLKLSLKHGSEFEKIAVLGNKRWQEYAAKIGSWFIAGDVRYFEDEKSARAWLNESTANSVRDDTLVKLNY